MAFVHTLLTTNGQSFCIRLSIRGFMMYREYNVAGILPFDLLLRANRNLIMGRVLIKQYTVGESLS
jgi:hypothetical protein